MRCDYVIALNWFGSFLYFFRSAFLLHTRGLETNGWRENEMHEAEKAGRMGRMCIR